MRFLYDIIKPNEDEEKWAIVRLDTERATMGLPSPIVAECDSLNWAERLAALMYEMDKPVERAKPVEIKADERPNKYSILLSDTGRWQIVKKTEKDGHWIVFVKDCGTKRLAVLMLNAILQSAKEGTPEQRIMSASDG